MSNFSFSQSSLQDFVECPRRFELRYLQKVRWPGYIKDQPADLRRSMELGNQFHLFCQQVFSGVPEILIRQSIHDPALQEWWENFSVWRNDWLKDGQFFPEITLHTHIAGQRVLAKYDLIALQSSGLQIYDWKTSPARTPRLWLRQKIQTILYPLLLCLAGQNISSGLAAPAPESVMMTYWFANHPSDPEILPYSSIQFEDDLQYITNLITRIKDTLPGEFYMTDDGKTCRYCTYCSLCERPVQMADIVPDAELSFESALEALAAAFETQLEESAPVW